jgi:serine/threonine-protein kinase
MTVEELLNTLLGRFGSGDGATPQQVWNRFFPELMRLVQGRLRETQRHGENEESILNALDGFFRRTAAGCCPRLQNPDNLWRLLVFHTARKVIDAGINPGADPMPLFARVFAEEMRHWLNALGSLLLEGEGDNVVSDPTTAPTVSDSLSLEECQLLEELCSEFENRLKAGETPTIEEYLTGQSEPLRTRLIHELVHLERAYRGLRHEADYARRFPEYASSSLANDAAGPDTFPKIPGFVILSKLGEGFQSIVYHARQVSPGRDVALKLMNEGQFASVAQRQRFRFEAEALADLDHPNIVQIYQVGEHAGRPYLCLKYVEGGSLADHLKGRSWPPEKAATLLAEVARAVHHAHQRGILHRDLKPGNILLDAAGKPHVADFGLARQLTDNSGATRTGTIAGTLAYMAPEQARAEKFLTERADVYALGAILYELLTGHRHRKGNSPAELLAQALSDQPIVRPRTLNPNIPSDLQLVCLKCLEHDPADRFASAQELADELARFLLDEPVSIRPPGLWDWLGQVWRAQPRRGLNDWQSAFWMGLVVLVMDVALCAVVWLELVALWAWGVLAARVGVQTALYGVRLRRFRELAPMGRVGILSGLALLVFQFALWFMYVPLVPWAPAAAVVQMFPPLQAALGLMLIINGATGWGRLLLAGLFLIVLSPLLAWLPVWAPLLHATMVVAVLWWWAYYTQRYFTENEPARV